VIFIAVKFRVRPEHADEFLDRVRAFTLSTRQEPGCLWFEWSRSADDPHRFVLLEAFRDADAGAQHVGSAHFKQAIKEMPPMLVEVPDIINVEVPGTEWAKLAEMSVRAGDHD
jgi:quinol monooxygenase YgiN